MDEICKIDAKDSFRFEISKIKIINHTQLAYTGTEVALVAYFGATRTVIRMDLGFGDRVEALDYKFDLTATSQGPIFDSRISLKCYPKEFIFAEKLETAIFRGTSNTRMKDFHDLYSLIRLGSLNGLLAQKAIQLVFDHRKTPLKKLPITFTAEGFKTFEKNWIAYQRKLKISSKTLKLPDSFKDLITILNAWLSEMIRF